MAIRNHVACKQGEKVYKNRYAYAHGEKVCLEYTTHNLRLKHTSENVLRIHNTEVCYAALY
jgi:hypothetical protein